MSSYFNRISRPADYTGQDPRPPSNVPAFSPQPPTPIRKSKIVNQKSPFALSNTGGFWELASRGQSAIVPQHQALFYVAWLLANPFLEPIPASTLAATVFELSSDHPDFSPAMFAIGCRSESDRLVASILRRKVASLEAILDHTNPSEQVKSELGRELKDLYDIETSFSTPDNGIDDNVRTIISKAFLDLHADLATAVDLKGNPNPVPRAFGRHLLLYLLIPSVIASGPAGLSLYTYHPPTNTIWKP